MGTINFPIRKIVALLTGITAAVLIVYTTILIGNWYNNVPSEQMVSGYSGCASWDFGNPCNKVVYFEMVSLFLYCPALILGAVLILFSFKLFYVIGGGNSGLLIGLYILEILFVWWIKSAYTDSEIKNPCVKEGGFSPYACCGQLKSASLIDIVDHASCSQDEISELGQHEICINSQENVKIACKDPISGERGWYYTSQKVNKLLSAVQVGIECDNFNGRCPLGLKCSYATDPSICVNLNAQKDKSICLGDGDCASGYKCVWLDVNDFSKRNCDIPDNRKESSSCVFDSDCATDYKCVMASVGDAGLCTYVPMSSIKSVAIVTEQCKTYSCGSIAMNYAVNGNSAIIICNGKEVERFVCLKNQNISVRWSDGSGYGSQSGKWLAATNSMGDRQFCCIEDDQTNNEKKGK